MNYPIHAYDQHGSLKAPVWLYLLLAFLGRTWLLLAIAAASRTTGADILTLFYPDNHHFYLGLAAGLPVVILLVCGRLKSDHRPMLSALWRHGRWLLLATWLMDLSLQLSGILHARGLIGLYQSLPLLASFWFGWYLLKSRRISDYFDGAHVLSHGVTRG
ncbi:DUF2919 domain-containing protein [Ferrimonas sediminicola]|uniref:DUF2919 domain-containing protein n=1 Tax=Ferrimonas sediminicola TaxID=2569538 RepID=UPI00145F305B|nr:DUF2919 domain-containing protein [Ferrimonas sediminicola]